MPNTTKSWALARLQLPFGTNLNKKSYFHGDRMMIAHVE
jgi:hypothetical protein